MSTAIGIALMLSAVGCGATNTSSKSGTTTMANNASRSPAKPKALTFTALIAHVRTGVIRIETSTCTGLDIGTGFLLGPRLVASVQHVVAGASSIALKQNGKVVGTGQVIGTDPARDVALIRSSQPIRGYHFSFATASPQLGEDVTAIGFPLGLPLTVTRGSVSGLDRTIPINSIQRARLIQTDAPVNPGNSGGPLIDDRGRVIGLVDLGTNQANGLAFAVDGRVAGPLLQSWQAAPQPVAFRACGPSYSAQAAPATATPPVNSTQTAAAEAASVIRMHWSLVNAGDYSDAYALFSPHLQGQFGESGWVADKERDQPQASAITVRGVNVARGVAVVSVDFTTIGQETGPGNNGCNEWTGSYSVVQQADGSWLINATNLTRRSLSCGG